MEAAVVASPSVAEIRLDEDHRYWRGDLEIPGVTHVLQDVGIIDYSRVPAHVLEAKSLLGRAVHDATWFFDEDDLDYDSLTDDVQEYLDGWIAYRRDSGFVPTHRELLVYSERYQYAGTIDRLGHLRNGRPVLPDIKTVATMQRSTPVQTAAYDMAAREMGVFDAGIRLAVQLFPDGRYRAHPYTDPEDFNTWTRALGIYRWKQNHT